MSLEEHNVTVLATGGAEHVARQAPIRSDLLEGISQKAPVPHLFVLDRDERSESEINRLETRLGECIHFLQRRELENYLLAPPALLQALRQKCEGDVATLDRIDATSEQEVMDLIRDTADGLQGRVLLKRIRAELPGLREGLLPREALGELIPYAADGALSQQLAEALHRRASAHLDSVNVETLVQRQREALDHEWADSERRVELAPGEELINAVFHHFGRRYDKAKDTPRIAQCMQADEVPREIHELLRRIVALSGSVL
jgi:hypothetical protein